MTTRGKTFSPLPSSVEFWKVAMRDHLAFLRDGLAITETKLHRRLQRLRRLLHNANTTMRVLRVMVQILDLKEDILERQISTHVNIRWTPSFLYHLVLETQEGIRCLQRRLEGLPDKCLNTLEVHQSWLEHLREHLYTLTQLVDETEIAIKQRLQERSCKIEKLQQLCTSTGWKRLSQLASSEAFATIELMQELHECIMKKIIVGAVPHHLIDHMIREQFYYLYQMGHNIPRTHFT